MKGIVIQMVSAFIISIGNFMIAFQIAWSSYSLEILESDLSPIGYKISKSEANLIGSLPMLGGLVATPLSGWLSDNLGRKRSIILSGLALILGWSILTTSAHATQILIGRFIIGFSAGIQSVVSLTTVGEIGQTNVRGILISFLVLMYSFGSLISYVSGWLLTYQIINYLNLSLSVLFVVLLNFLKETPQCLLAKGREREALESLKFYRGTSKSTQDIMIELAYLRNQKGDNNDVDKESAKLNEKEKLQEEEKKDGELSAWQIFCTSKPTQRAFFITAFNIILLVFGGTIAVQAYAGQLFSKAAPGISPHMCAIVLSIAFAVGSVLSTVLSELVGRRTLMISSAVASSLLLAALASLLKWAWGPVWMVPLAVLGYCCCFQMGVACVPFIQMAESFTVKMKSHITVISICCMCLGNFFVLAFFGPAVDYFGLDGTFLMFSIVCAITAVIAFFTMRETKGVPVEKIQEMYAHGYLYRKQ